MLSLQRLETCDGGIRELASSVAQYRIRCSFNRFDALQGNIWIRERKSQSDGRECNSVLQNGVSKLEICYREQGDFQKAYFYACQQKK